LLTFVLLSLLQLLPDATIALDNGLGLTPPMGFNTWNKFACDIHEDLVKSMAHAMIDSGLYKLGYEYINLDDCWAVTRNETGYIVEDPMAFPSGMAALVDYVHDLELKFGLYSDAGVRTCAIRPGSLGYEVNDATMYAEWKVDYLKVPKWHGYKYFFG
jgi:alpha-galactosidase